MPQKSLPAETNDDEAAGRADDDATSDQDSDWSVGEDEAKLRARRADEKLTKRYLRPCGWGSVGIMV